MTTLQHTFKTKILKVDPSCIHFPPNAHLDGSLPTITDPATEDALLEAAKIIRDTDETVAFPTETVYGLGGSSLNDNSVKNIYKAKNRPSDNPLISHVSSVDQLNRKIYLQSNLKKNSLLNNIPKNYHSLIKKLWPGPLTIILPTPNPEIQTLSKLTTADQPTFAVRIPSNPVARALIALSDTPIAAPSANASTRPSPTQASHVFHDLQGRIPLILDGGSCDVGVESTVIDGLSSPPMLLRPGGFTYEQIVRLGGEQWSNCKVENKKTVAKGEKVRTPGMKYKHYSPSAKVVLLVPNDDKSSLTTASEKIQKFIDIIKSELTKPNSMSAINIAVLSSCQLTDLITSDILLKHVPNKKFLIQSLGTDGETIQTNLFSALRKVDEEDKVDIIFVEGIHETGEGLAIMNRLKKAAGENNLVLF
ncbi:hypothetical protein TBLA_0E03900 [Henningerozyma blattae CBS 6284]|uniref:Threonylcarbamoyl-AMP synthase n=1 Tax=Henningerozyma blattae (strain ATCC 34711 / CBS 6284 / DSM 70876 / NBRC 10599 / NRRL Y-10934 / UCD 77-7) TaxID=1071380 RepID=I2H4Z3_HENB6|nr:hypothetical protein TBLA_0E03900 [Tetrapisispora blattae CBS 6284]CCH61445.1 hypothetical protein TBLA_0E03900 [Tetrapisispora blattae CBS 6284]